MGKSVQKNEAVVKPQVVKGKIDLKDVAGERVFSGKLKDGYNRTGFDLSKSSVNKLNELGDSLKSETNILYYSKEAKDFKLY